MRISIEELIVKIVHEVIAEMKRQNITLFSDSAETVPTSKEQAYRTRSQTMDMSSYRTPLLTENHLRRLHELTGEIVIPKETVLTPKAREIIREKQIKITLK